MSGSVPLVLTLRIFLHTNCKVSFWRLWNKYQDVSLYALVLLTLLLRRCLTCRALSCRKSRVISLPVPCTTQHKGRAHRDEWGVVRPVNNSLYLLCANKNANAEVWRVDLRLFDNAAERTQTEKGNYFFFLPPCLRWWERYTESRESYQAVQTWCWEPVIHYRWQPLDLSMHSCCREDSGCTPSKQQHCWLTNITEHQKSAAFGTNWSHLLICVATYKHGMWKKMLSG